MDKKAMCDYRNRIKFDHTKNNNYVDMSLKKKKNSFLNKPDIDYSKLKVSEIGKYSIMRHRDATKLIQIIYDHMKTYDLTITDATGGIGGTSIYLSDKFKLVKTVEIDKFHQNIIENNIKVYGFKNNTLYKNNYLTIMNRLKQDVIVIDPPWGGKDYKTINLLDLYLEGINIVCIINDLLEKNKCELIILFIPFNYNLKSFGRNIKFKFKVINRFIKVYK